MLSDEDQPQDIGEWKRLLRKDQERQYERYAAQFDPGEKTLHNTSSVLHKRNEKWNEYMADYRKRKVECPKCNHQFRPSRRVK